MSKYMPKRMSEYMYIYIYIYMQDIFPDDMSENILSGWGSLEVK